MGVFAGSPYEAGFAQGRLLRGRIRRQETHLDRLYDALIPSAPRRFLIRSFAKLSLPRVARAVPAELRDEIAGIADGYEPTPDEGEAPAYRRLLALHALHDFSQRYVDAPGLTGCTGFVAGSRGTKDGSPLLARNFDFEAGSLFDDGKLVSAVSVDGTIPYLSVSFPGSASVVTGVNREGIGLAINALTGGATAASGMPVTLLATEVLRHERTLEGAIRRLTGSRLFVSDLVLLGDGKTGDVAIVELSPKGFHVRRGAPGGTMGVANAAEGPAVARPLPASSTSPERRARLEELLARSAGTLDLERSVAILRDRAGFGDAPLGLGSRAAIDGFLAVHSVVLDLGRRRAYVALPPHALGAFVEVDLERLLAGDRSVRVAAPEDPLLADGTYARWKAARAALVAGMKAQEEGDLSRAGAALDAAALSAPAAADVRAKRGEILARLGRRAEALTELNAALALSPSPRPLAHAVLALREALATGAPLPPRSLPMALGADELLVLRDP